MSPKEVLIKEIEKTPASEIGSYKDLFEVLAKKLSEARLANDGFTPHELFLHSLEMGGISAPIELLIQNSKGEFAVKKRGNEEDGWNGQYQIIGTVCRPHDTKDTILERLSAEFGKKIKAEELKMVGIDIRFEVERKSNCVSNFLHMLYDGQLSELDGEWKWVDPKNIDDDVISHHKRIIRDTVKRTPTKISPSVFF